MEAKEYRIESNNGQVVSFSNIGASIMKWIIPTQSNEKLDIILGFNEPNKYKSDHPSFGSIVGRYANRIDQASFFIDDNVYTLEKNIGEHHLHGASSNYAFKEWNVNQDNNSSIEFSLLSKNKEGGYPGDLKINVKYSFNKIDALDIEYNAVCDNDTVINLTNHSYFNLNGESSGEVLDHEFQINADHFIPTNSESIPTGVIQSVQNTIMDLRISKILDSSLFKEHPLFINTRGYDHNYVLGKDGVTKLAALVYSKQSGLTLECYTNKPGLQLYLGNFLEGFKSKDGSIYKKYHGFCLESQFYPDSPNHNHFSNCILRKGERYNYKTSYRVY